LTGKWVIVVSYDLEDRRQARLSSLLDIGELCGFRFLRLESGKRWIATSWIDRALIFDDCDSAHKLVNLFREKSDLSEFLWIRGCYLEVLELSVEDWNLVLNSRISEEIYNLNEMD
jgi:hypothetical protein